MHEITQRIIAFNQPKLPAMVGVKYRLMQENMFRFLLTASSHLRSSGQDGSSITDQLKAFAQEAGWQEAILAYAVRYSVIMKGYYKDFMDDYATKILQPADTREEQVIDVA